MISSLRLRLWIGEEWRIRIIRFETAAFDRYVAYLESDMTYEAPMVAK